MKDSPDINCSTRQSLRTFYFYDIWWFEKHFNFLYTHTPYLFLWELYMIYFDHIHFLPLTLLRWTYLSNFMLAFFLSLKNLPSGGVPFMLAKYSCVWILPWSMFDIPSVTQLSRTEFPSSNKISIAKSLAKGVTLCLPFFLLEGILSGLSLCRSCML